MKVDRALLSSQILLFGFSNYVRIFPTAYQATPLGCAVGQSRFGGSGGTFATLYAAKDVATALAEAVVRDRFEGLENRQDRSLFISELSSKSAVQIGTAKVLRLVDLRMGGCLKLGISTEITGAKCFEEAQRFSDFVHNDTSIDGILYSSRLTSENCVAIFDRATCSHLSANSIVPLTQLEGLADALQKLNVQLID